MADFVADIRDLKFVLFEQMDLDRLLSSEKYNNFTREDLEMILEEAYKFAREVLAPINAPLDRQGCTFKDGKVTVPEILREPRRMFAENGWLALSMSPDFGGQGAPDCVSIAVNDLFFGACVSLCLGALLASGAAHLIEAFGTDELKQLYVEKMYTGTWAGTMCLTESQAGSDVGASTTRAVREGDHYLIEGEKIFITFGEHDLTENIIHAVLARIEGAPKGTKGLSLFVVPKYRVNADGSLGEFNDVACSGIEHKLGINATPTCSLVFGQNGKCQGWLLGEENQGMRAMFQMMNEARISVGLQGVSAANASYQYALSYCKERLQGPDIRNFKDPDALKAPIIKHPDVRMMLMRQKAYAEGMRAMLIFAAYCADRAHVEQDERSKARYQGIMEVMTPICKAYCSDMGFRVTEWALQCYGGYGYVKEYPAEQYLRDCKIASIYEGTNGIQAMDLVARKLSMNGGANLMALVGLINNFIDQHKEHPVLKEQVATLAGARDAWGAVNGFFMGAAAQKKLLVPLVNASGYLSLCGDLLVGYFLVDQAVLAWTKLQPLCQEAKVDPTDAKALTALARDHAEVRFLDGKIKTARFYCSYELPQVKAKAKSIQSGDMSALHMVWEGEGA
jgi:alkylation response protein AidB-like acyl-CoA dehydrogenase